MKTTLLKTCMALFIVFIVGCSKEDALEIEPDYGTMTAIVNGEFKDFDVTYPWEYRSNNHRKWYILKGTGDWRITIEIPDSIAKPGSYTHDDGVRAQLGSGGGFEQVLYTSDALQIDFSIFSDKKAVGTFEFMSIDYFIVTGDTIRITENFVTNGTFDINRN